MSVMDEAQRLELLEGWLQIDERLRRLVGNPGKVNAARHQLLEEALAAERQATVEWIRLRVLDRVDAATRAKEVAHLHEAFAILIEAAGGGGNIFRRGPAG